MIGIKSGEHNSFECASHISVIRNLVSVIRFLVYIIHAESQPIHRKSNIQAHYTHCLYGLPRVWMITFAGMIARNRETEWADEYEPGFDNR